MNTGERETLFAANMQDVQDGPFSVHDVCTTGAGRCTAGPEDACAAAPILVQGKIAVGPMRSRRETFEVLENPELRELLSRQDGRPDVVAEAVDGAQFSVLDADVHTWPEPPSLEELDAAMRSIRPVPEAFWASHGRGMKMVFTGPHHLDRALAAAFAVPRSYEVELLKHTRLPGSTHSGRPGAECGPVVFNPTDPGEPFVFGAAGEAPREKVAELLDSFGMHMGGRFGHDICPIDPGADSTAKDCIVVKHEGIQCFRCAAKGVRMAPGLPPGFAPYGVLVGGGIALLDGLAKERVHWTHAELVLRHERPNLSPGLLRAAYSKTLISLYGEDDPRVGMVFDRDLDFIWGEGVWLASGSLEPTTVDNDAANCLPYCCDAVPGEDRIKAPVDPARRAQVKHRAPRGYAPLRPYRGITFLEGGASVPVQVPPRPVHAIRLLSGADLMPEAEAFAAIEAAFPRLHQPYLIGCLTAAICAEAAGGQPPMLAASGPSGSGKGETVRLAASFMGDEAPKVQLISNPEPFMRQLGALVASGSRFIVFDEIGKVPNLANIMHLLLQISSAITWRPLYQSRQVQTPCRAAFFYPCVRFPDFITQSAEFARRTWHVRLHRKTPPWAETSGGDTAVWRDRCAENARAANSLLTHAWMVCREHGFQFSAAAEAVGLGSIADADAGVGEELLRALYAHARGEDGKRVLYEGDTTFRKGWINLDGARARELVSAFVALDDADNLKAARRAAQANLEAQAWNDALGIDSPPIRVRVLIHGAKWGMRFESSEPAMRGREQVNEQLPPANNPEEPEGAVQEAPPADASSAGAPPTAPPVATQGGMDGAATEALLRGGFPA